MPPTILGTGLDGEVIAVVLEELELPPKGEAEVTLKTEYRELCTKPFRGEL